MKDSFQIEACAKINLFLDITACRADGYHLLNSVMQQISLADQLRVTVGPRGDTVTLHSPDGVVVDGEKNLAWRGAKAFFAEIGEHRELTVELQKNIPMKAGLGGGSADCAAILRGLNAFFGHPLSTDRLCAIGATLGADVPFCVCGGTMRAEGIGEILTPLSPLPGCHLVVAMGRESMATPLAFARLDAMYDHFGARELRGEEYQAVCHALAHGDLDAVARGMYNVFEDAVFAEIPVLRDRLSILQQAGAVGARMSGSGAAVFGIFAERKDAEKASELLRAAACDAWVCVPRQS